MSQKINHYFNLSYSARDSDTGDTEMDFSLNFENPKSHSEVAEKLVRWLTAIGHAETVSQIQKLK